MLSNAKHNRQVSSASLLLLPLQRHDAGCNGGGYLPLHSMSSSKRPERFHGAFTGGFSAGFFNSVGFVNSDYAGLCRQHWRQCTFVDRHDFVHYITACAFVRTILSHRRLELPKDGLHLPSPPLGTNGLHQENSGLRTSWMTKMDFSRSSCRCENHAVRAGRRRLRFFLQTRGQTRLYSHRSLKTSSVSEQEPWQMT